MYTCRLLSPLKYSPWPSGHPGLFRTLPLYGELFYLICQGLPRFFSSIPISTSPHPTGRESGNSTPITFLQCRVRACPGSAGEVKLLLATKGQCVARKLSSLTLSAFALHKRRVQAACIGANALINAGRKQHAFARDSWFLAASGGREVFDPTSRDAGGVPLVLPIVRRAKPSGECYNYDRNKE
jgi:hypothetical protein